MNDLRHIQVVGPDRHGVLLIGLDGNGRLWQGFMTPGARPAVAWTRVEEQNDAEGRSPR